MPNQYSLERAEDTLAQKTNRRLRLYRIMAVGLLLIFIAALVWFYTTASVASQKALRNAKDLRIAMKMAAIEAYSDGTSIYDPTREDGLSKGVRERLKELCEAPGEVTLTGWDKAESDAISFTYQEGSYIVMFRQSADAKNADEGAEAAGGSADGSGTQQDNQWEVYLFLRVTDFH